MTDNDRYLKNCDSVRTLGEILGFKLHSFDPDWRIVYFGSTATHDVPDEFMEMIAKYHNLKWDNGYNSELNALSLHRARKERYLENEGYNTAWIICDLLNEMRIRELKEKYGGELIELCHQPPEKKEPIFAIGDFVETTEDYEDVDNPPEKGVVTE
ncbi:MAG: hypothetical protein PHH48_07790, partial [Eubacteriales bacterium]|nr:hypothetical protein [Eubacteriales bacterium]